MINQRKVLAVVPARGGSKGIPLKNLRQIRGRALVSLAGDAASQIPEIDRRVVSTDHPKIACVAREAGLDVPFMRPETLAGDRVSDWDVLTHALLETEKCDGLRYDIVVMLQPTSPLRRPEDVSRAIVMLVTGGFDAVWTVSETDSKGHPMKQLALRNGYLDYWDSRGAQIIARQQLDTVYHRNGVAYVFTRDCLLEQRTILGNRTGAYIVAGESISIDTERDIADVEFALDRGDANLPKISSGT
jgi:CMP-N,N'-diacetyllegionaminic acid synthase